MFIAIDIGGTHTRLTSRVSLSKNSGLNKISWKTHESFDESYQTLIQKISRVKGNIQGIAIGFPGKINRGRTRVLYSIPLMEWENREFLSSISKKFLCPVYLENDVVMGAMGAASQPPTNISNFVYISWGTGIGGAMVKRSGVSISVVPLDWITYFLRWNKKCGGKNVELKFQKLFPKFQENEWSIVIEEFCNELQFFQKKFPLKHIILGGGIAIKRQKAILEMLKKHNITNVSVTPLGDDAGLYGGFELLRQKMSSER